MQLSDLRTAVYEALGVSSSDAFYPAPKVTRGINDALDRLAVRYAWPWLETLTTFSTVVGTANYNLPADHRRTLELWTEDGSLEPYQRRDITRFTGVNGKPRVYAIKNNDIYLAPVPTEVLTINHLYIGHETALANDSDQPLIPDAYNDLLVVETAMRLAVQKGDSERVDMLREARDEWIRTLRDEVRQSQGAHRIRTRRDWGML